MIVLRVAAVAIYTVLVVWGVWLFATTFRGLTQGKPWTKLETKYLITYVSLYMLANVLDIIHYLFG